MLPLVSLEDTGSQKVSFLVVICLFLMLLEGYFAVILGLCKVGS